MSNETAEQDIRYLKWRESLLCWTSLSKENCALKLDLHSKTSSHTTLSNENQSLELCLDQAGRETEMLKRRVTELDTTVLSIQGAYNELFCLKEKLILDNDTMDKELQELRSYQNLFQEDEFTQEANTSSDLEELEESKNRTKALVGILDDAECQRNTLPSQFQSKKKRKLKLKQRRDSWGRYCLKEAPNLDTFITPRQFTRMTDLNASPDLISEYTSQPMSLVSPRVLRSNKYKLLF